MTNRERAAVLREIKGVLADAYPVLTQACEEAFDYSVDLLERTPDMKPMTMDEAISYGKPVFVETVPLDGHMLFEWNTPNMVVEGAKTVDAELRFLFRYWPDRPTPEQSAAWPWEDEISG